MSLPRTLYLTGVILLELLIGNAMAQDSLQPSGFHFTSQNRLRATAVKNQSVTSTCWSFATSSFLESELLRMGKGESDLSEMFVVRHVYPAKALNYVRRQGKATFDNGSLSGDLMRVFAEYGAVPETVYDGKLKGYREHNNAEMDAVLKAVLDAVIARKGERLSPVWQNAFEAVLDAYLGNVPKTFEYKGKTYTPKSYAATLGIRPGDYIELTSFSHHPFYSNFALEIPDNWANNAYFNVPLDEFMAALDHALETGYTVGWDGDVSEKTFGKKKGIAILPLMDWEDMNAAQRETVFDAPQAEKTVDQALRQNLFDNYASTDDHLMHITGIARDQHGARYYITKNSYGTTDRGYEGYVYMSEAYVRAKTVSIMMHRDALPDPIDKQLSME